MTEAETCETSNGNSEQNGAATSLDYDIIKQVKHDFFLILVYFENLF